MGITASGPLLVEEFRDDDFAVGRHAAGAGSVSRPFRAARRRPTALAVLGLVVESQCGRDQYPARCPDTECRHARAAGAAAPTVLDQLSTCVLDGRTTRCAPHRQRLRFA